MILSHDPSTAVVLSSGQTLLYGHVHGLWRHKISDTGVKLYNVGVDVHNMMPISIEYIKGVFGND